MNESSPRAAVAAWLALGAAAVFALSRCSTGDACRPAPGSCGGPAPSMYVYDAVNVCLSAAVTVPVCDTEVNACTPSAGLGPVCAIAPDGTAYFAIGSDNDVLTEPGWRFAQSYESFGDAANSYPPDEMATGDAGATCAAVECAPPCPGVSVPSRVAWCP